MVQEVRGGVCAPSEPEAKKRSYCCFPCFSSPYPRLLEEQRSGVVERVARRALLAQSDASEEVYPGLLGGEFRKETELLSASPASSIATQEAPPLRTDLLSVEQRALCEEIELYFLSESKSHCAPSPASLRRGEDYAGIYQSLRQATISMFESSSIDLEFYNEHIDFYSNTLPFTHNAAQFGADRRVSGSVMPGGGLVAMGGVTEEGREEVLDYVA